jgi:hypothetical protein
MSNFALDVSKWAEKAKGRMDLVVRKIALDLFRRVILRSPVDTGRFRGNWQVAIDSIPEGVLEIDDKSGAATVAKATAEALNVKAGDVIYLVNNLPYASRLENGWSPQAPAGIIGTTVTETVG